MMQLTREGWQEAAGRLGEAAQDCRKIIEEHGCTEQHPAWETLVQDLELAAAAMLWVSEYAAEKVCFFVLDEEGET